MQCLFLRTLLYHHYSQVSNDFLSKIQKLLNAKFEKLTEDLISAVATEIEEGFENLKGVSLISSFTINYV